MKRIFFGIIIIMVAALGSCGYDPTEEPNDSGKLRHTTGANADSLHKMGFDTTTSGGDSIAERHP